MLKAAAMLFASMLATGMALAETARIAVATNFAAAADDLARVYSAESGHLIDVIAGATGKLYAQIRAGAPFDAFLSADRVTPARLVADGAALADTRFTYGVGRLALWSADPARDMRDPGAALAAARRVAIANPDLAPYGLAAVETLRALGLPTDLGGRVVTGENIGQAQTMVATGAADLGFVAASGLDADTGGAVWLVPGNLHSPLQQDAVILPRGATNAAALGFLDFLKSDAARIVIASAGYGVP